MPGQLTVTQITPQVVLNWQSFGILPGESVRFVQPNRQSLALNRVLGSEPSVIQGSLTANGQVFLLNPQGVLFGAGGSVNVGGLVASTLSLSDADFLAGRYRFEGAGPGIIVNQGHLQAADGGYVALLSRSVYNEGVVKAQLGSVALAAGQVVTLSLLGDGLLNVAIDQGVAQALLSNAGLLQADGGTVLMSTQAAGQLLGDAVNNTGVLQAQTLENQQGRIVLLASPDSGTLNLGGQLDVRGGAGQQGGSVTALGKHVGLFSAQIDASGGLGGGVVWVGGGFQGKNPDLPAASAVYMSPDSLIRANATAQGSGGQVVLWATDSVRAGGQILARGGPQGGAGGMVETSAHGLNVQGLRVDTQAPQGPTGTWLLDPADVTISSLATTGASPVGNVFMSDPGTGAAQINVADLVTALGGTNVTVTTTNAGVSGGGLGDIQVNAAIVWTAPTTLSLNAVRDVRVNQAITATDGSLSVVAGRDVQVDAAVTTTTGKLSFTAVQDVALNAATTITTGDLTAVAGRDVRVTAAATVTTGNMVFRADNDGTGPGVAAGTVTISCSLNCLTVTTGQLDLRFNPVSYASTTSEILAYGDKLTGGGTLNAKAWVFGKGDNKMYDGTPNATVSGLLPDVTSVAPPVALGPVSTAQFDTRHVGTAKPIVFETTFLDAAYDLFAPFGTPAGTYQARADVVVRPLTVSAVTDVRAYDGSTQSVGVPTVTGLQVSDTLNGVLSQTFASKDVLGTGNSTLVTSGSYTVTDGHGGGNYAVTVLTAPGTITPAALTITAQDLSKVYGQTPDLTGFVTSALVNGETVGTVALSSPGQLATAAVAGSPYPITPSGAAGGTFTPGNYSISYVNGALSITPAVVVPPVVVPPDVVVPTDVVVPPVVVPPDVVVPPVVVPPDVVVPPVVVPPQVVLPEVAIPPQVPVPTEASIPPVAPSDDSPVVVVIPPTATVQGPVVVPVAQASKPVPVLPTQVTPSRAATTPRSSPQPLTALKPLTRPFAIPVLPRKQDRN